METTFACLGWGSLIWMPGDLPVASWQEDGPPMALEFARLSKDGRVTLVVTGDGTHSPVLWTTLDVSSLEEAVNVLAKREGCPPRLIGRWPSTEDYAGANAVASWTKGRPIAGVVWTALPAKWKGTNGLCPTLDEVTDHITTLDGAGQRRAAEYILRAPRQVKTTYRAALTKIAHAIYPDCPE